MNTHLKELPRVLGILVVAVFAPLLTRAQPANDMFVNRTTITGTSIVVTEGNAGATRETGEPSHAGNSGGASVWWSWTAPYSGFVTVGTAGSSIDTVLGIYTGSAVGALTWVAYNDDENYSGGIFTSKAYFDVTEGQTYQIAVDGYLGETGTVRLSLVWEPFPVAASWSLPDPYGAVVNSSSYAGKVIIFDFWATWCGPCKVEIPDYVFLQDKYGDDGLVIVGPSVDSTAQAVVTFLATNSPTLNYQVVMANYGVQQAYGGVSSIPTTFVIDRQNIIRKKYVGTRSRSVFEKAIIPLLYGKTCLNCQPRGGQLELCWRNTAAPFALQYSSNPSGAAWSQWPTAPTLMNGTNFVTVPATGSPRFFRLRMAY